jgi:hypothetical protein
MQEWLIRDKMLSSSLKQMRYKNLIEVVDLCREDVS